MMIKTIAFDFDGVFVLDSEEVFKQEAWEKVFIDHEARYEPLLEEAKSIYGHGKAGGRMEIIQHVFERLGEPADSISTLVQGAVKIFSDHMDVRIAEAGLVPGAIEMLKVLSERKMPMYLNSGTATQALEIFVETLNINHFFSGVLGSTKEPVGGSKVENLRWIAKQEGVKVSDVLVVGDGDSDVSAAQELGCSFIGVANKWNGWEENMPFPIVHDLQKIPNFL